MSKISMLSEEFIKTIAKNKKNEKTAGVPGMLYTGAMGVGAGVDAIDVAKNREAGNMGGTIHGMGNLASSLGNIPQVGKVVGSGAMGRMNAFGAPFAAYDAVKELGGLGESWSEGDLGGVATHGAMAGLNGTMAASGAAQGMNTYRSIAGTVGRNAPGVLNSAKNIAGKAAPAIAEVAPAGLSMGLKALPVVGDIAQGYMYGKANHSIGRGIAAGLGSLGGRIGGGVAGTFVAPGVGTAVGEIGGSVAGAYEGAKLYDAISGAGKPVQSNTDPVKNPAPDVSKEQPKTPATDAALGKAPTPAPASSIGTADNNKVAPLPEQKSGIPSVGQPNSAPVSGAGNKELPSFDGPNMLKESEDNRPHYHLIIRLELDKNPSSAKELENFVKELAKEIDMKIVYGPKAVHLPYPETEGWSTFAIITSSHISVHTWDVTEVPLMQIDIFSCNGFSKDKVTKFVENKFKISKLSEIFIDRTSAIEVKSKEEIKEAQDQISAAPSIDSVKPMEHIPRPPESPDLIQNPQFASPALKEENRQHNLSILQAKTEQRKSLGLPPNPFLGRVTGVEQTTGGVTTQYKPSSNAIVTDQNEALERATPMHGSKVDQVDMLNGNGPDNSGFKVNNTGNGGSQLIGPDGKVHGTMQVNPAKPVQPLAKSGSLRRRNTGIGDWVNPEDFKYLNKSAAYMGVTPEEYIELPISEKPDTIVNFFTPFG